MNRKLYFVWTTLLLISLLATNGFAQKGNLVRRGAAVLRGKVPGVTAPVIRPTIPATSLAKPGVNGNILKAGTKVNPSVISPQVTAPVAPVSPAIGNAATRSMALAPTSSALPSAAAGTSRITAASGSMVSKNLETMSYPSVAKSNAASTPVAAQDPSVLRSLEETRGKITEEIKYNYGGFGKAEIEATGFWNEDFTLPASIGAYEHDVEIPESVIDYVAYFTQLLPTASLPKEYFAALWKGNEMMVEASLNNSIENIRAVAEDPAFYHTLHTDVFDGTVPYHRFLPAKAVDYIYVGEVHYNYKVQEELLRFLHVVKNRYPTRNIYLATEYVWETRDFSHLDEELPLALATNQAQLEMLMGTDYAKPTSAFLKKAIDMGIDVVGLEPCMAMRFETQMHTQVTDPVRLRRLRHTYSASALGMQQRNEKWILHINQIRKMDPDALVVVHGGAAHVSAHNLTAVPHQLEGSSFSVMLFDQRAKEISNPILARMEDEVFMERQFDEAKEGKYVISLKKPDGSAGRTPEDLEVYKESFGTDVVVFVKDAPKN